MGSAVSFPFEPSSRVQPAKAVLSGLTLAVLATLLLLAQLCYAGHRGESASGTTRRASGGKGARQTCH